MIFSSRRSRRKSGRRLRERAERFHVGMPDWRSSSAHGSVLEIPELREAVRQLRQQQRSGQPPPSEAADDPAAERIRLSV